MHREDRLERGTVLPSKWMKPGARLRWLHPFFEDMAEEWKSSYYGNVLSGRYAGKVGGIGTSLTSIVMDTLEHHFSGVPELYISKICGLAVQVALQRAVLLARACSSQSSSEWSTSYCQLMKGCEGENIQTKQGVNMIDGLANTLKDKGKPLHLSDKQLVIDDFEVFMQVRFCCLDQHLSLCAPLRTR